MNKNSCTLKITAPANFSATDYTLSSMMLFGPAGSPLQIKVKAGCTLQSFAVSGTWSNTAHSSFDVALDGSQEGIGYSLIKIRDFPTTPVVNTLVASMVGTGSPITFGGVTQKGIYKVIVQGVNNTQVEMSGVANMYDNADMLVAKSNHIKTKTYRDATGSRYDESATHYDGLGRDIQIVNVRAGGNGNDVVQIIEYDNMGRSDTKSYMPYTRPNLGYQMSALANTEQTTYYNTKFAGDSDRLYAYGQKSYQYTATTDKVIRRTPGSNTHSRPRHTLARAVRADENIKKLVIAADNRSLRYVGNHAANAITAKDSWQETGSSETNVVSTEYHDTEGRLIARRMNVSADDIRTTYYVHDNLGKQRYIIPPEEGLSGAGTYTPEQLGKYCFYNEYDKYGQIVMQYVPGTEPVYSVYDKRGRLVMSQSGNQRADGRNEWSYMKYDAFDRQVYSGLIEGGTLQSHREAVTAPTNIINEKRGGDMHGYTRVSYPADIDSTRVLAVTYYDDYTWVPDGGYTFNAAAKLSADPSYDVTGLQTGSKSKVLGIDSLQWLTSVTYYDKEYQTIQSITDLYPQGTEIVSNDHDFTGEVIQTRVKQIVGTQTYEYNKWFAYDSGGRLLHVDQQITGDAGNGRVRIAEYTYDDMNLTRTKAIHNAGDTTTYNYRMTGQLISEVSPSFSYALGFDRPADTGLSSLYDGRLASVAWGSGNTLDKAYNLAYDGSGQMLSANFSQKSGAAWNGATKFAEKNLTYDKNGNIKTLSRTAELTTDDQNLTYYYEAANDGNRLTGIRVNNGDKTAFAYDSNGNMVEDGSTGIGIKYNTLNLPEKIYSTIGNTDSVRYIYSAGGEKLATVAPNGSLTFYRSVFVYARQAGSAQEQLLYLMHPEGIVACEGGAWGYKYFKRDHIGSTRVLLAARGGSLVEEQGTRNDFYPFGLSHGSLNNLHLNKYLYGGKEYQDAEIGGSPLGLYDFHARYYNPMLGRWFNQDPALQTVNPYLYCGNSPMYYIDKDGRIFWFIPMIIGAVINVGIQYATGNINSFGDLALAAGVGALSGLAGFGVGSVVSGALGASAGGFIGGAITGASSGAAAGFVGGAGNSWAAGNSFADGLKAGGMGAAYGAAGGAVIGGVTGGIQAVRNGGDFWTGKPITPIVQTQTTETNVSANSNASADNHSVYKGLDGENNVRYVGRTGQEPPELRFDQHARAASTGREVLDYRVVETNLPLEQSRVLEQTLINEYGLGKDGGQLLNKINSIAPAKWDAMGVPMMNINGGTAIPYDQATRLRLPIHVTTPPIKR